MWCAETCSGLKEGGTISLCRFVFGDALTWERIERSQRWVRERASVLHLLAMRSCALVLAFVGPGHALYVSTVCKAWQQTYETVADAAVHILSIDGRIIRVDCTPNTSFVSSAFASPERLQLAFSCAMRLATN